MIYNDENLGGDQPSHFVQNMLGLKNICIVAAIATCALCSSHHSFDGNLGHSKPILPELLGAQAASDEVNDVVIILLLARLST